MSTWIAFTDRRLELCLLNTTSHEVRHFFPDERIEYYSWSPDGRYLAFSAIPEPSTNDLYTLFLFEIENKTLQQVTQTRGRIIWSWSPDGRKLLFLDERYGGASWLLEVERGTKERLGTEPAFAIWSRESGELVGLWPTHSEDEAIYVMGLDGGHRRLLAPGEHMTIPRHGHTWAAPPVNWSPNGRLFASHLRRRAESFDSRGQLVVRGVDLHLQVVDIEGKMIFERPWEAHLYRWSPDSRHLACLVTKTDLEDKNGPKVGKQAVCVLPWDGSTLYILGSTRFWPHHRVAWSPDGQYLAFAGYPEGDESQSVLWLGRADGQQVRALTEPLALAQNESINPPRPTWSPDGSQIAFVATRSLLVVDVQKGTHHSFPDTEELSWNLITGEIAWQPLTHLARLNGAG